MYKLILTALAALAIGAGSLKAGDAYRDSAFGSNPLQSPPTVPVRIVN